MANSISIGDRVGIVAAIACGVHCLAAPLLASVQFTRVLGSERVETAFLVTSLMISGVTCTASSLRRGARHAIWVAFTSGAAVLVVARLSDALTTPVERGLVVAGASLIVVAHVVNLFGCRCAEEGQSCAAIG